MTTSRVLLCLTLLCGATYPSPAAVIPLEPPRSPLALLRIESESQHYRNPFDEHLNLRVNSDNSGQVQNEEQACISPIDGNVLVAVWRDFRLGYRRVGVGYSHDNGLTWHDELFPQMFQPWQSDPTLVVDGDGTFTANVITFDNSTSLSDLIQVSSYDGGTTWQDTVWAAHNLQPPGFEDKQMLAVDVSGSPYHGTFYCSWSRFYNYPFTDSLRILLTYKRPGEDYSDPIILSTDESVQWSNVCVGAEGQVYVSWIAYDVEEDGVFLKFARSLNGGETWTPEQTVVPTEFFSANVNPDLLIFSYGALACDVSNGPHRGRLYMIYTDATRRLMKRTSGSCTVMTTVKHGPIRCSSTMPPAVFP